MKKYNTNFFRGLNMGVSKALLLFLVINKYEKLIV